MDYAELQKYVEEGMTQRGLAALFGVSQSSIKYWLRHFHLRTKLSIESAAKRHQICVLCKNGTKQGRRLCPSCWTRIRRYRTKVKAVMLLGGKCAKCGWKGHPVTFDFHHVEGKDFSIGSAANKSWAVVARELKKCVLLCANCHRIEHIKGDYADLIEEAHKYFEKAKVAQTVVAPA